ncbi:hypothetical protein ACWEPC_14155, partial [Nonomuraea sp. NPDC004297]
MILGAHRLHLRVGDQAGVHDLDLVRAVPAEAQLAGGGGGELHARTPAEPVLGPRDLLHENLALDARQPAQLLGHDLGLEPPLRLHGGVLPVAAAAAPRARVRAGRDDAVGGGLQDLDGVGPQEARGL